MKIVITIFFVLSMNLHAQSFMSKHLTAEFKQQIKSKVSGKVKESDLNMDYSYPGKFYVEGKGKNNFTFVSNGLTSWYYRPPFIRGEMGEVTIRSVSHLKFLRVFDALYKGAKTEGYFKVSSKEKEREFVFTKKIQDEIGTSKVIFKSSKKLNTIFDSELIEIYKVKGSLITLKVKSLKKVNSFQLNRFEFKIPSNTKTVKD